MINPATQPPRIRLTDALKPYNTGLVVAQLLLPIAVTIAALVVMYFTLPDVLITTLSVLALFVTGIVISWFLADARESRIREITAQRRADVGSAIARNWGFSIDDRDIRIIPMSLAESPKTLRGTMLSTGAPAAVTVWYAPLPDVMDATLDAYGPIRPLIENTVERGSIVASAPPVEIVHMPMDSPTVPDPNAAVHKEEAWEVAPEEAPIAPVTQDDSRREDIEEALDGRLAGSTPAVKATANPAPIEDDGWNTDTEMISVVPPISETATVNEPQATLFDSMEQENEVLDSEAETVTDVDHENKDAEVAFDSEYEHIENPSEAEIEERVDETVEETAPTAEDQGIVTNADEQDQPVFTLDKDAPQAEGMTPIMPDEDDDVVPVYSENEERTGSHAV